MYSQVTQALQCFEWNWDSEESHVMSNFCSLNLRKYLQFNLWKCSRKPLPLLHSVYPEHRAPATAQDSRTHSANTHLQQTLLSSRHTSTAFCAVTEHKHLTSVQNYPSWCCRCKLTLILIKSLLVLNKRHKLIRWATEFSK